MTGQKIGVAIVGAGAAGLMAAISAGRAASDSGRSVSIVAFDGAPKIGAKILIAGGGRCNVTHEQVSGADFNGSSRNAIARVLRTFDVPETVAFFREIGAPLQREESGKLFPTSNQARTVLDALLRAASDAGAAVRSAHRISGIHRLENGFRLTTNDGAFEARNVILATGGRSVPETGSDGGGYSLARSMGHSVTDTIPALVPLLLPRSHWLTSLSGVSLEVELALLGARGRLLQRMAGSMLLTHFGLSGPVVLDMSRHWLQARMNEDVELRASIVPGRTFGELEEAIVAEARENPRRTVGSWMSGRFPDRFATALLSFAALPGERMIGQLTREERRRLLHSMTELPLPVTGDRGFRYAEATAGGVPLTEIELSSMESRIVPRLHLCGEILDVDGRIGGFNFQWAWASGRLAGISAVERSRIQNEGK
ncbi:MAG: NAD(P)/FAD-dependent oxidoreductase [Thermoanaerobaculia bacterium]